MLKAKLVEKQQTGSDGGPVPPEDPEKAVGWTTNDGQRVEPDKDGRWPAVHTTPDGHTIVAGGPPIGNPDQV